MSRRATLESSKEPRRWIFLRGLSRGRGHWADFISLFQERFPQDQVELLDLPGNGERGNERSPRAVLEYVEDLRAQSTLLAEGPVHLLALSLGGMIAAEWRVRYPQEVAAGFLVCTSSACHSSMAERFRWQNLPQFASLAFVKTAEEYEQTLLSVIANNEERRQKVMLTTVDYTRKYPAGPANFFNQILAARAYCFPMSTPGELYLIGSYGDRMVSPKCTQAIAEAWGVPSAMHPWAGHDVPVDDPFWLLDVIERSLSKI